MPVQTIEALLRSVRRGEFAPVYYLHGSEDLLKEEMTAAILERALDPGLRDFNFDQRSAAQLDPEDVYALCNTPPMMADRRVVLLRDVEAWKRKPKARATFLKYLEHPSADAIVILVQGAAEETDDKELARLAVSVACDPLPPDRAAKWVLHRAKSLDVVIEPDAARHLVRAVGVGLGPLAVELEKLAATSDQGPVTPDRIAALVGVRHGETVFDWRDAVFGDDAGRAAALLSPVLAQAGVTGVRLVTLLGTTLVGLGALRSAYDRKLRGPELEDAAFKLLLRTRIFGLLGYKEEARRWAQWVPGWPQPRIRAGLSAALRADQALKGTTISDDRGIVLDLIMGMALAQRGAA
jgi:DNA polymerase-3 subunit delta